MCIRDRSDTATVTKEQAGTISMNGYGIEISEGDTLAGIMGCLLYTSSARCTGSNCELLKVSRAEMSYSRMSAKTSRGSRFPDSTRPPPQIQSAGAP